MLLHSVMEENDKKLNDIGNIQNEIYNNTFDWLHLTESKLVSGQRNMKLAMEYANQKLENMSMNQLGNDLPALIVDHFNVTVSKIAFGQMKLQAELQSTEQEVRNISRSLHQFQEILQSQLNTTKSLLLSITQSRMEDVMQKLSNMSLNQVNFYNSTSNQQNIIDSSLDEISIYLHMLHNRTWDKIVSGQAALEQAIAKQDRFHNTTWYQLNVTEINIIAALSKLQARWLSGEKDTREAFEKNHRTLLNISMSQNDFFENSMNLQKESMTQNNMTDTVLVSGHNLLLSKIDDVTELMTAYNENTSAKLEEVDKFRSLKLNEMGTLLTRLHSEQIKGYGNIVHHINQTFQNHLDDSQDSLKAALTVNAEKINGTLNQILNNSKHLHTNQQEGFNETITHITKILKNHHNDWTENMIKILNETSTMSLEPMILDNLISVQSLLQESDDHLFRLLEGVIGNQHNLSKAFLSSDYELQIARNESMMEELEMREIFSALLNVSHINSLELSKINQDIISLLMKNNAELYGKLNLQLNFFNETRNSIMPGW